MKCKTTCKTTCKTCKSASPLKVSNSYMYGDTPIMNPGQPDTLVPNLMHHLKFINTIYIYRAHWAQN